MNAGFTAIQLRFATFLIVLLTISSGWSSADELKFQVAATADELILSVQNGGTAEIEAVAVPAWTRTEPQTPLAVLSNFPGGTSEIRVPRRTGTRDLLFTPIALRNSDNGKLLGAPQWVTSLAAHPARTFEFLKTTNKKGLNCVVDIPDAVALGVQHANVNISIRQLVALDDRESEFSTIVDGKRVPMHAGYVRYLDEYIGGMTAAGINVTGILLNYIPPKRTPDALIHPDTNVEAAPNHMGAFNMTSEDGVRLFRAAMQFLAERYTRTDRAHGWMPGMIVGNEVQSHWFWNNQGEVSEDEVIRDYHVALRLADLIGRSTHAAYRVYASLDHHWTRRMTGFNRKRSMPGDAFLEKLNAASKAGGDFPWDVAFHPYPENLFEPRFWENTHAPLALNAPVVTFKNIEVLPAFLKAPEMMYGGKPRRIALTEQGFHRKDSAVGERTQAAALALGYYKVSQMPEIDFVLLHRHQDHPHEGGLNLGVLDGKKRRTQAWEVYRAMDTPDWKDTAGFALEVAGMKDWSDVLARGEITSKSLGRARDESVVYDFFAHGEEAKLSDVADWRAAEVSDGSDSWLPAILQHPKGGPAPARAEFLVDLPKLSGTRKLVMHFMSALNAPSVNGVGFRLLVNDEPVFSEDQRSRASVLRQVDLSQWAGQQVKVTLSVDSLGNTAHDLAAWIRPRIVVE